ncbi:uncharacterized protein BCR38DRAFT_434379 [Pseudomassariella vexata]|uniref:Uncharacterized protein n=1 Tax=Pseudomassariella vexata TaxID=1141098 RepID=A0A1Y2DY59_9PEZI|nr:uncharacterized protein BCR38DRAFT_434379 [Pseudomassariella vexata]ORY64238.1 hypothetical protein BCR38DRAFT_434379 [Pseudomassariella vexata]
MGGKMSGLQFAWNGYANYFVAVAKLPSKTQRLMRRCERIAVDADVASSKAIKSGLLRYREVDFVYKYVERPDFSNYIQNIIKPFVWSHIKTKLYPTANSCTLQTRPLPSHHTEKPNLLLHQSATMQYKSFAVLFSLVAIGATQNTDNDIDIDELEATDFPVACQSACLEAVNLSTTCDAQNSDNDAAEKTCVCGANNAQSFLTSCAACTKANGINDGTSDLAEVMQACGWSYADVSASTASGAAATASAVLSTFTSNGNEIVATVTSGAGAIVSTITSDGSEILTTITSGVGGLVSTITSAAGDATSTDSTGAGPVATPCVAAGLMAAGILVGLPAFL